MAIELGGPEAEVWEKTSCDLRGHMAIPTLSIPVDFFLPINEGEWERRPTQQHSWGATHSEP